MVISCDTQYLLKVTGDHVLDESKLITCKLLARDDVVKPWCKHIDKKACEKKQKELDENEDCDNENEQHKEVDNEDERAESEGQGRGESEDEVRDGDDKENRNKGGYNFQIYNYATNRDGCTPNSALPYQPASLHACSTSSTRIPESKVESYFNVPKNESEIRFYLYNKGPLSVVMNVYENFYSYSSGVYSTISGNYIGVHAALLVGYGSENGVDYWMVKNSWGTSWGLSGYFKIKRGSNFCRIEDYRISYPEV